MNSEEGRKKSIGSPIQASDFQAPSSDPVEAVQTVSGLDRGQIKSSSNAAWWQSQFNLMLCVFGLLGAATVLFILLTPAPQSISQSTLITADGDASRIESRDLSVTEDEQPVEPFSESQRDKARSDSQDVLSDLLDLQKELELKGVKDWAKGAYEAALLQASNGDELYKQQAYQEAITQYQSAVTELETIEGQIPTEIRRRVSLGLEAVSQGKSNLAKERFQEALSLDRNYIPALQGLDRVQTLDQALDLISAAKLGEQDFTDTDQLSDIQYAKRKYLDVIALDSQLEAANLGVQRTTMLETDKKYRQAMSEGFNALFKGRYSAAKAGFNSALAFKPDDQTASSALRQSLASDKRTSLASLLSAAKAFERKEQWASALSNYQTVLQRDRNQVGAKIGGIRSQARVDLDKSLKKALEDPLALSKSLERERAQVVLDDARGIRAKGPILNQQIAALEASFKALDSDVKVAFNSDSLTQVMLKKAGAKSIVLGRFDVKKLALKPGRYTLTGSRLGFRDVRTDLELTSDTLGIRSFTIACSERMVDAG